MTKLSACRPVGLSACRPVGLSACRPIGLSACRPVGLSAIAVLRQDSSPQVLLMSRHCSWRKRPLPFRTQFARHRICTPPAMPKKAAFLHYRGGLGPIHDGWPGPLYRFRTTLVGDEGFFWRRVLLYPRGMTSLTSSACELHLATRSPT